MHKCPKCGHILIEENTYELDVELVRSLWLSFRILEDAGKTTFRWKDVSEKMTVELPVFKSLRFFDLLSFDSKSGYKMDVARAKRFFMDQEKIFSSVRIRDGKISYKGNPRKLTQLPNLGVMLEEEGYFEWLQETSRR